MQNIKDSFYVALRDRLALRNPARVITVQGNTRPAVLVAENEVPDSMEELPDTFILRWGQVDAVRDVMDSAKPLLRLECAIHYWVQGSDGLSFQDRGRALAGSDAELLALCDPAWAVQKDFREEPPADQGTNIFWTRPALGEVVSEGRTLGRVARLSVFGFAPEEAA